MYIAKLKLVWKKLHGVWPSGKGKTPETAEKPEVLGEESYVGTITGTFKTLTVFYMVL